MAIRGEHMKTNKVIAAVCGLTYFALFALVISSLIRFGIVKNFAILFVLPFAILCFCYAKIVLRSRFSYEFAVFATIIGCVISVSVLVIAFPIIAYWALVTLVESVLSWVFLCCRNIKD